MYNLSNERIEFIERIWGKSREQMQKSGSALSKRYRQTSGEQRRITNADEAAAYTISRMPATYAAASMVMDEARRRISAEMTSHLDCGSGTAAVILAVQDAFADSGMPVHVYYQEKEKVMSDIGQMILKEEGISAESCPGDVRSVSLPAADLVTEGYMLGELSQEDHHKVVQKMWQLTRKAMILIEPGTPEGFRTLREAREIIPDAQIAAPCPDTACQMVEPDWCHFAVRVGRTQLHKVIKGGDAPFEDEKFCYLILVREGIKITPCGTRILRHPQIQPGKIQMTCCTVPGIQEKTITKKDLLWKQARKVKWGDALN